METLFLKNVENSYNGKYAYLKHDFILDKDNPFSELIPSGVKVLVISNSDYQTVYCRIIQVYEEYIEYDYPELLDDYYEMVEDGYCEMDLTEMFIDYVLNGNHIVAIPIDNLHHEDPFMSTPKEITTLLL